MSMICAGMLGTLYVDFIDERVKLERPRWNYMLSDVNQFKYYKTDEGKLMVRVGPRN